MTAHDYDKCKHFGVYIPDDPTEEQAQDVLKYLRVAFRLEEKIVNLAEVERTRGTPGEAIPMYEMGLVAHIAWVDSPELVLRVLKDGAPTWFYKGPTLEFLADVVTPARNLVLRRV